MAVNRIPNANFVPIEFSHENLVKSAQICASVNGSVGWESLLERTPSVSFTQNWHSECSASPYVRDKNNLKKYITTMRKMSSEDVEKHVLKFINEAAGSLVYGCLNENHVRQFIPKNNVEKMRTTFVSAILERL